MEAIDRIKELVFACPAPTEGIPAGTTLEVIRAFTSRTGVTVPNDMRDWLQLTNGPCVGPGGLYGIQTAREELDIESMWKLRPRWKVKGWIPIASDGCGNDYVMATRGDFGPGCPVVFFDIIASRSWPAYSVASGLSPFLVFLLEAELGKADVGQNADVHLGCG
jgi:cell wall assembly regulator SMI1